MNAVGHEPAKGTLALRGISKSFPGVKAVDDVSLEFYPGEIHALMGENGAGKSTLMKMITGIYQPDSGEMSFGGKPLRPKSYRESLAMGIDIVHQEIQAVPDASIAENIMLDKLSRVVAGGRISWKRLHAEASLFMRQVGLNLPASLPVRHLSAAHKQLIQIARALAARATVILLDEPTSSLSTKEADTLLELLEDLKRRGVTLIYVSHKLEEVYRLADRISILRDGKLIGTRKRAELERRELVRMMIGRDVREQRIGPTQVNEQRVVLKVEGLTKAGKCRDISFELREGEILGFYGLVGAGRSEFARVLIGEDPATSGSVWVNGKKAVIHRVSDALFRYKVGYVTENRKEEGLFLEEPVLTNLTLLVWEKMRHRPDGRRDLVHRDFPWRRDLCVDQLWPDRDQSQSLLRKLVPWRVDFARDCPRSGPGSPRREEEGVRWFRTKRFLGTLEQPFLAYAGKPLCASADRPSDGLEAYKRRRARPFGQETMR
jgi:ribose transport system ATP-binding protein